MPLAIEVIGTSLYHLNVLPCHNTDDVKCSFLHSDALVDIKQSLSKLTLFCYSMCVSVISVFSGFGTLKTMIDQVRSEKYQGFVEISMKTAGFLLISPIYFVYCRIYIWCD